MQPQYPNLFHLPHRPSARPRLLLQMAHRTRPCARWRPLHRRLFVWGGILIASMVPELVVAHVLTLACCAPFKGSVFYRHAKAAGTALTMMALVLANVVGFSAGVDGARSLFGSVLASDYVWVGGWYFAHAQINHAFREWHTPARSAAAGPVSTRAGR